MTDQITVPRATWDALRGALDTIIQYNRDHARDQYGDAEKAERWACVVKAREALTAANAVSVEPQAQIPPEGSERAEALIKAMLKEYGYPANPTNAARAGYRAARLAAHPQATEPARFTENQDSPVGKCGVLSKSGEAKAGGPATNWATYPEKCPITRRDFFMVIEHPELGMVPTFGGPYDSYTIPHMGGKSDQQMHERELECHRFDHDRGHWVDDEIIPLRVIHDDFLSKIE